MIAIIEDNDCTLPQRLRAAVVCNLPRQELQLPASAIGGIGGIVTIRARDTVNLRI